MSIGVVAERTCGAQRQLVYISVTRVCSVRPGVAFSCGLLVQWLLRRDRTTEPQRRQHHEPDCMHPPHRSRATSVLDRTDLLRAIEGRRVAGMTVSTRAGAWRSDCSKRLPIYEYGTTGGFRRLDPGQLRWYAW
eukprot:SAG22_NODE_1398_length_4507_cov_9.035617_5_plen_134_part_00